MGGRSPSARQRRVLRRPRPLSPSLQLLPCKAPLARRSMGLSDCNACNGAASGRPTTSILAFKSGNERDVAGKKKSAERCNPLQKVARSQCSGTARYGTILQRVAKSRCLSTVQRRAWSNFDAIPTSGPCSGMLEQDQGGVAFAPWSTSAPGARNSLRDTCHLTARWGPTADCQFSAIEVQKRTYAALKGWSGCDPTPTVPFSERRS